MSKGRRHTREEIQQLVRTGDPPALLRNNIDGHKLESEFSGLSMKPC